jgi:hypothetical protein
VIILSGVLVVLAIALLVTGIVTGNTGHEIAGLDGLKLIYISIGVSIISALFLAVGVFVRRKELFGTAVQTTGATAKTARTSRPAKTKARVGAADETQVTLAPTTVTEVPAETTVWVVPGRKRYHLQTCRQLAGRDKEELTYVEAREEGFTACTACLPDTALAARAASTETEPSAETSVDAAAVPAESGMGGASMTRTDLPITRLPIPEPGEPATAGTAEIVGPDDAHVTAAPADTDRPEEQRTAQSARQSRSFFEPLERTSAPDEEDATSVDVSYDPDATRVEDDTPGTPEPSTWNAFGDDRGPSGTADEPAENAGSYDDDDATVVDTPRTDDAGGEGARHTADQHDQDAARDDEPPAATSHETDLDTADTGTAADGAHEDFGHGPDDHADDQRDDHQGRDDHQAGDDDTIDQVGHAEPTGVPMVRILSGTKRYHRPDCALIEDIADDADDLETLPAAEAKDRGCTPCLVCQPDKDSVDDL